MSRICFLPLNICSTGIGPSFHGISSYFKVDSGSFSKVNSNSFAASSFPWYIAVIDMSNLIDSTLFIDGGNFIGTSKLLPDGISLLYVFLPLIEAPVARSITLGIIIHPSAVLSPWFFTRRLTTLEPSMSTIYGGSATTTNWGIVSTIFFSRAFITTLFHLFNNGKKNVRPK